MYFYWSGCNSPWTKPFLYQIIDVTCVAELSSSENHNHVRESRYGVGLGCFGLRCRETVKNSQRFYLPYDVCSSRGNIGLCLLSMSTQAITLTLRTFLRWFHWLVTKLHAKEPKELEEICGPLFFFLFSLLVFLCL